MHRVRAARRLYFTTYGMIGWGGGTVGAGSGAGGSGVYGPGSAGSDTGGGPGSGVIGSTGGMLVGVSRAYTWFRRGTKRNIEPSIQGETEFGDD